MCSLNLSCPNLIRFLMGSLNNSYPNSRHRCSSRFETWLIETIVLTSKEFMAFDLYSSKVIMSSGITRQK